ncbi:MAG: DUF2124 domain-containing protein [Methanomicrobiales archaeon HGW-Methanomicrobiales-1]|jgi:hypothetical protein|nr:MAG: DUF2124 domain-containing protein [Methanomicrobiales archaeon HGW-Methanomicrobiales-1]
MTRKELFHGVEGILDPFKDFLVTKGLKKGDQVVYYGVPGTCTPFVEMLGFAINSLELEQVFVPMMNESKAYRLQSVREIGMQARVSSVGLKPKAIVILGGLSMPDVPVKVEKVKAVIDKHPGALVMGFCFMHMFEKAGWLTEISFDCLIDAMIDPVEVTTKS